ncbi:MAG: hypothetical protein DMF82_17985 [Acidobacteria bacterium]|nr:MAG: hypothetical protein DMF82_17985 [Acidobacteriota bacterium]
MKTSLSFLLSVAALAVAVAVFAQTALTVSGTVVSSSPTQVVIKTDDGRQMTFAVDAQSTVPAGLAQGNPVTVSYHEMGGGTFHAASVTVSSAGMPSTTANPPSTDTSTYANTTRTTAPAAQEPMESAGAKTRTTRRMPSTASPLPLIGLAGLLSLSAGLGLRALRRSA